MSRRLAVLAVILALAVASAGAGGVSRPNNPDAHGLTGQLLVATDDLREPRFQRTVIFMVRHDATGAMGLVVNRPMRDAPLAPLLDALGRSSAGVSGTIRLHYGGPVEPGRGFLLHTVKPDTKDRTVWDGVALTTDPAMLDAIGHGTGPRRWMFALGYAGWAPGQLEAEIERGSWISVPADEALIFDEDAGTKWERAMARRRIVL